MAEKRVDVGRCLSYGWKTLQQNLIFHILAGVLFVLVHAAVNILGSLVTVGLDGVPVVQALLGLLQVFLSLSLTSCFLLGYFHALSKIDAGADPELGDLFSQVDKLAPAVLTSVLYSVLSTLGFLCCILPSIVLLPLYPTSLYLVYKGESDSIRALKKAWAELRGELVMAIITMLSLGCVAFLGFLACGVGAVVTLPICYAGLYKMTTQVFESTSQGHHS